MKNQAMLKLVYPDTALQVPTAIRVEGFHAWFGENHVLNNIQASFKKNQINGIVGPSGSGKSTLIRSINRINDEVEGFRHAGKIYFNGQDIYDTRLNVNALRAQVGMVFQKPCVFPKSISQNVLLGIQHLRKLSGREKAEIVEEKLKAVFLWKEVSHRLHDRAHSLSLGQQQRLCIARTLAVNPEVILLDEPTSSLDPVSTRAIEELLLELKNKYTVVFVTHDILQAKRIADYLIFLCNGQIIEEGTKEKLFHQPESEQTRQYLNNEYCDC